jgi:hypothetical protein
MRLPRPAELDELKSLREAAEACWVRMDLALLQRSRGVPTEPDCDALAAAYRSAVARHRLRCLEHLRELRPETDDAPDAGGG